MTSVKFSISLPVISKTMFVTEKRNRFSRSKASVKSGKSQEQSEKNTGQSSCEYTYLQKTGRVT